MTSETVSRILCDACHRMAPLLTIFAGISTLAGLNKEVVAVVAMLSLACYVPGISRRESLAWGLIAAAVLWGVSKGNIDLVTAAAGKAAVYGSLMIAISFVQVPVRYSVVAQAIAAKVSERGRLGTSWKAYMFAHAAGAALNLSGLIILQVAIQRAALGAHARLASAVVFLRGFSTAPVWSPYSYFTPLMLAAFPALTWSQLMSIGAVITVMFVCLSVRIPPALTGPLQEVAGEPNPVSHAVRDRHVAWRWGAFTGFFASVVSLMSLSGFDSVTVIVVALPILAMLWGFAESLAVATPTAFVDGVCEHITRKIPMLRTEILALGAAGMLSYVIAQAAPTITYLQPAAELGMSGAVLQASFVFAAITALTWLGINPILFVVPMAALVADPASAPFSWVVALMILCCAWALFPTISPFAAATLVTARETVVDTYTLVAKVNAHYNMWALACCLLLVVTTVVVTRMSSLFY